MSVLSLSDIVVSVSWTAIHTVLHPPVLDKFSSPNICYYFEGEAVSTAFPLLQGNTGASSDFRT